jgi:hypothetical protein
MTDFHSGGYRGHRVFNGVGIWLDNGRRLRALLNAYTEV